MYSPEKIMTINAIIGLAWIPKILWGALIDKLLTRKIWITLSIILDILTVLFLGIWSLPLVLLISMMFVNSTDSAIRDVAVDGTMCVEGKKYNITGKIQSLQWIFITIATVITGFLGGYLAEHFNYKIGFLVLIPFYLLVLIPTYYYKETKNIVQKSTKNCMVSYKKLYTNKSFLWACLFLFLYKYSPSFGIPLSYIERDSFKWSFQFIGIVSTISSIVSIIGAVIYWKVCQKINVIKWLYISVFLGAITSLSYLYFTPLTDILYTIMYSLIGMFVHLILMDWMAKTTIKGIEATSFALLCGINNLAAGTASTLSGAFLYPRIGLTGLIILSAITSFICLPIIKKLKITNE
jgi:hypothetical protein